MATKKTEKELPKSDEASANPATFVVTVRCRQRATWQGSIQWLEKKKTVHFRSALELIRLMDEAVEAEDENRPGKGDLRW